MNDLIKILDVEQLDGHWLRIRFSDGAVKDVDLSEFLARGGGHRIDELAILAEARVFEK